MAEAAYRFDELTREMVVSQLRGAPDAPHEAAVIARKTIAAGLRGTRGVAGPPPPGDSVRQICRGMIAGMILLDGDLPRTAVELLTQVGAAADETHTDRTEMMTWALRGIADNARVLPARELMAVTSAIDAQFMGTGELFGRLCHEATGG